MKKVVLLIKKPVAIVMGVAFFLRVVNLNYNSPFIDESIYLVLGRKVLFGHWHEGAPFAWVGGMPLFYPALSAFFGVFGIVGARFLSVLLGTMSVYLTYEFAKGLKLTEKERTDEVIGLMAALLLAILAVPLYLSRLAIYDMLSNTLLLAGLVVLEKELTLKKPELWQRENKLFLAAVLFFLAFLAKYIALIFLPLVGVWALYRSRKLGKNTDTLSIKYFILPLVVAVVGYILWYFQDLHHFLTEQVGAGESQTLRILIEFLYYSLPVAILGVVGAVALWLKGKRVQVVALLVGAMTAPLVHIVTNTLKAAEQHSYFVILFLLPLCAYVLVWFWQKRSWVVRTLVVVTLVLMFADAQTTLSRLETSWPNTTVVMNFLKSVTTNHEKVLSMANEVTTLALPNLPEDNITNTFDFDFQGRSGSGAYRLALEGGYFDFVVFDEETHEEPGLTIKNSLTAHYSPVFTSHPYVVYKRNVLPL